MHIFMFHKIIMIQPAKAKLDDRFFYLLRRQECPRVARYCNTPAGFCNIKKKVLTLSKITLTLCIVKDSLYPSPNLGEGGAYSAG
jgi:hypothetical protein